MNNLSAKTKKQIANEYGVCIKTLNNWLKDEQIILKRGLIRPSVQKIIYDKLGIPKYS
jgi:hypothetical protein